VFDKDMTGVIGVGQLRYSMYLRLRLRRWSLLFMDESLTICLVLTNLGEKMSDEEVDELLKAVDTSSGEINYTGMFGPSSLIFLCCAPSSAN
jgi:Ca2+-binding EF-hand superfamily protein